MSWSIAFLELGVLALAAYPAIRLAADRQLGRLFPRFHRAVLAGLVLWLGGVVALAALAPPVVIHVLAVIAGVALAAAAIRARPHFGAHRRLPPGSLSVTRSVQAIADRRYYLTEARRHGPIFKAAQFHRPMACVVGLERGHRLLREHFRSMEAPPLPYSRDVTGGFLRYMNDATHRRYGPALRRALARPVVSGAEPVMAETARSELDRMAAACVHAEGGAVCPGPHFQRIVHDSLVLAMFGMAPGTDASRRFEQLFLPIAELDLGRPAGDEVRRALRSLRPLLMEQLGAEGGNGAASVSSLTELRRIDPGLPDSTCLDNLVLALRTGGGNVVSLLSWLVEMLGQHPEWGARARSDLAQPEGNGRGDLVDRFVLETLRLAQREYAYRELTEDVDYEGFRLPKGWLLRVCVWESHRRPEAFDDPETFSPDRFLSPAFNPAAYSPFGQGQHACTGIPVAKTICRTVLEELLTDFEYEVAGSGPPERDFRHWDHWRPSSSLTLRLTPRVEEPSARASATS